MSEIIDHGLKIGQCYMGTDGHKRTVQTVEYHYGNIQVKSFDAFCSKVEWLALTEWNQLNPNDKIVRP